MDAEEYAMWFATQETNTFYFIPDYIGCTNKWLYWHSDTEEWERIGLHEIESAISDMCNAAKTHLVSVGKRKEALQVVKISFIKAIERHLRQYMTQEGFQLAGISQSRFIPKGRQHPKPIPLTL